MTTATKTRKTLTKKVANKVKKVNSKVRTFATGLVDKTKKNNCKNICIDYPQNNETVYCGHYCFRLGARKPCSAMQVSINGGEWQNCRQASGYWWFDWWSCIILINLFLIWKKEIWCLFN